MVPVMNTINKNHTSHYNGFIARTIHFGWMNFQPNRLLLYKDGCLHKDLARNIALWRRALPHHSILVHFEDGIRELLHEEWPEFPLLQQALACAAAGPLVQLIDIWRLLVLYKHGGVYIDTDIRPTAQFHERIILPTSRAFFLTDSANHRQPLYKLGILHWTALWGRSMSNGFININISNYIYYILKIIEFNVNLADQCDGCG